MDFTQNNFNDNNHRDIAFLINYPCHYRVGIYKKLAVELNADFYFGDIPGCNIKPFKKEDIPNYKQQYKTIKIKGVYWYLGSIFLLFKPFKKYILTGDPHILSNWLFLILAKLLGKKVYFWTHGWYGDEKGIKKRIKKIYNRLASGGLFLYGDYAKKILLKEDFSDDKLIPIYNSLNYEEQKIVRDSLVKNSVYRDKFDNDNPVLFFIGRVQRSKNLEQVLDAMSLLKESRFECNFVVVGEEEPGYDFKSEVYNRNLENNVWLYGPSYIERELGELIYNSNVCVSPSSIGLTAIHSLTYGTPVITNNDFPNHGPEFEAIIDGYNGTFFEKDNVEDLCSKIKKVIKANYSKEQCFEVVDNKWNPYNQIEIFKRTLIK